MCRDTIDSAKTVTVTILFSAVSPAPRLAQVLDEYLSSEHCQQQEDRFTKSQEDKVLSLGLGCPSLALQ